MTIRELLSEANYDVLEASDGKSGEKAILLNTPDLIILDLGLPGRRGEEVLKFIKKHEPTKNIPIIILTGANTMSKRISCMVKGASSFIAKPYENVELLKAVKKYV